jgi:signal transduction histidine kinase/DNA-binding response OmpR family regulator
MRFSGRIALVRRPAAAALLAVAATLLPSPDAQAAERIAAASDITSAQLLAEPIERAQHRVPGEHGTPTLTLTDKDPRLLAGFSLPTTLPELRRLTSQFQPTPPGFVIIFLLAVAAGAVFWRRIRHPGAGVSRVPPEAEDAIDRPRHPKSRATQYADGDNLSEHERIVRACSQQLAYLGHELRTPVTAVVGNADSLSRADLPPEQRRCVDTILSSCDALTTVVDSFLDFSRIQSDTLVLEPGDFDLRQLVDDAMDMLSYSAHAKGLELAALVNSDVPVALNGDAARLRQVLVNLLGNAVKFTERGHIFLRVSCKRPKSRTPSLRFDVCDTGCGVSTSKRGTIFDAFVRADVPAGQLRSGIGLGLYLAKVLVQKMGGKIGVDGVPDVGSTFWFTARFDKQAHASRSGSSPALVRIQKPPVLIVDKSSLARQVLAHHAEAYETRPCAVPDAAGALDALKTAAAKRDPFAMLFIDAGMDGVEILRLLETIREDQTHGTPELVMLTGPGADLDPIVAALMGQYSELTKPLKQSQVAGILRTAHTDSRDTPEETLPRAVSHTEAMPAAHSSPPEDRAGARLRVLLAEDNPVALESLSLLLRDVGCDVDVATDGLAAIRATRQTRYDAIFMDFQMPGLDGCQASREILRHEIGDAGRTPIIALTASAPENIRERCLRAGMIDYLFKPVRAKQLQAVLAQHCRPESPSSGDGARTTGSEDNPVAIDRLRTLFLEDSQARLRQMRQAARDGNWEAIANEAHGLVGSARMVGATDMSSACKSLEAMALSGDPTPLAALRQAETEFERVRARFSAP